MFIRRGSQFIRMPVTEDRAPVPDLFSLTPSYFSRLLASRLFYFFHACPKPEIHRSNPLDTPGPVSASRPGHLRPRPRSGPWSEENLGLVMDRQSCLAYLILGAHESSSGSLLAA